MPPSRKRVRRESQKPNDAKKKQKTLPAQSPKTLLEIAADRLAPLMNRKRALGLPKDLWPILQLRMGVLNQKIAFREYVEERHVGTKFGPRFVIRERCAVDHQLRKHGYHTVYDTRTKQVCNRSHYVHGVLHGPFVVFRTGSSMVACSGTYVKGKRHGMEHHYRSDGSESQTIHYEHGRRLYRIRTNVYYRYATEKQVVRGEGMLVTLYVSQPDYSLIGRHLIANCGDRPGQCAATFLPHAVIEWEDYVMLPFEKRMVLRPSFDAVRCIKL